MNQLVSMTEEKKYSIYKSIHLEFGLYADSMI
jgi:hypothetical protein